MRQTKHTPGPWSVLWSSNTFPSIHAGPTSVPVASLYAHTPSRSDRDIFENAEANARLIAAAPELLEALNGIQNALQNYNQTAPVNELREKLGPMLQRIIAKATGGSRE